MFRIWFKIWKNGKIIKDMTIERPDNETRTHKVIQSLEECCRSFDLSYPIWFPQREKEFLRHSKTRFDRDSFMEEIDFNYLEVEIIEEDDDH